ncbi:MAG TPA: hypothetical protein VFS97_06655 [Nitrososphaeraceae archaeon]|nr:hypothetical protein [Nitrososphaeraceae archaeon]
MRNNKHAKATIIIVTMAIAAVVTSLFAATMTIGPRQADALSIYDPDATNPDTSQGSINQPLEQDDYTTTTTPTVSCAMDTIESLQSFLSCLGAK